MEETTKAESSFIDQIAPPRPEDAGLEDCALPPESIEEAFLKAASAVRSSRVYESDDEDESGDRVADDPWGNSYDASTGVTAVVASTSEGREAEKPGGSTDVPAVEEEKADAVGGLEIGGRSRGNLGKTH